MVHLFRNRPRADNGEMLWKSALFGSIPHRTLKVSLSSEESGPLPTLARHLARVDLCSCWRVSTLLALANCCLHSWSPSSSFSHFLCHFLWSYLSLTIFVSIMFARYVFPWRCWQSPLSPAHTDRFAWAWVAALAAPTASSPWYTTLAILIQINCPFLFIVHGSSGGGFLLAPSQSLVIILSFRHVSDSFSRCILPYAYDDDNVFYSRMRPGTASAALLLQVRRKLRGTKEGTWIVSVILPRCFSCYTSLSLSFSDTFFEWMRARTPNKSTLQANVCIDSTWPLCNCRCTASGCAF